MSNTNINNCDIVQDLLPLYYDDACSPASRKMVEAHLAGCEKCRRTYEDLKNDTIDEILKEDSRGVLERHEKSEKTAAYKAGVIIAGLLLIPILITFIVGLAGGVGLDVSAVVTASMLLVAAFTVVPLISKERRLVKCILTGVIAILLIYFFVDRMNGQGEFILWTVPTIFGLSVVLFPFVIRGVELPVVLADKKALITMLWDTLWLFFTIVEVCGNSGDLEGMREGSIVAAVLMVPVWLIFLVARYLNIGALAKSGIIVWICGVFMAFANDICQFFVYGTKQLTISHADLSVWITEENINSNVYVITLIVSAIVGTALLVAGLVRRTVERTKKGISGNRIRATK